MSALPHSLSLTSHQIDHRAHLDVLGAATLTAARSRSSHSGVHAQQHAHTHAPHPAQSSRLTAAGYHVKYDDADEEDVGILEVREILLET